MLLATIPKTNTEEKKEEKPKEVNGVDELAQYLNIETE
jgi:hypothetical protein